jgi:hypothetical protein
MTIFRLAVIALALALGPARAADDATIARLVTCQDSWLDWSKTAPARFRAFADHFRGGFTRRNNDPFFVPKTTVSVAGLRIVQAFPDSVGMGVGFSVIVDAGLERTQKVMEATLKKKLTKCEASDGMHSCEYDFAPQRSFTLMAQDDTKNRTLIGCYYYYEK